MGAVLTGGEGESGWVGKGREASGTTLGLDNGSEMGRKAATRHCQGDAVETALSSRPAGRIRP